MKFINKSKNSQILWVLLAMVGVFVVALVATGVIGNIKAVAIKTREEKTDVQTVLPRGEDGLPFGIMLSKDIIEETDDYVVLKDRVLVKQITTQEDITWISSVLNEVFDRIPNKVNKTLMLVPARIGYEQEVVGVKADDVFATIDAVYANMPASVKTIDITRVLAVHRDEYIYFRTSDCWTALGAYYGAKAYGEAQNISIENIEAYEKRQFDWYYGNLAQKVPSIKEFEDMVTYYLLIGGKNKQEITDYSSKKSEYSTFVSPLVAASRKGANLFVGGVYSHSIVAGDIENGRVLMLMGDNMIKTITPWLTSSFETIVLVNPSFFDGRFDEFWDLYDAYPITDFMVMQASTAINDEPLNKRMLWIVTQADYVLD